MKPITASEILTLNDYERVRAGGCARCSFTRRTVDARRLDLT
jgi:hypothetical protein